jgi:hypothetical protein
MSSPSLLDRAERRFGHLAISGLLRAVAGFQALCFVIIHLKPEYREFLALTPAAWEQGEIWRFFTFCFIPQTTSVIFIIFAILILLRIGDVLEEAWGKFRVNVYFFANLVCLWAAVAVVGPELGAALGGAAGIMLYTSLFLAFATIVPDYTFLIFFVLPVKVKWLGLIDGAYMLFLFITISFIRLPMAVALVPYAVFGLPILIRNVRHGAKVSARRATYQSQSLPKGEAFHECAVCHRTDHSDPSLEFRIADDDKEYCSEHLPR